MSEVGGVGLAEVDNRRDVFCLVVKASVGDR